jgi:hypothetical protein
LAETDIERVDVGTFTAHVAAFEHEGDIAEAAAARLGAAEGVVDDPVIDRARFVEWVSARANYLQRAMQNDAIGGRARARR